MYGPDVCGVPRAVSLGGTLYWVRPFSMDARYTLLAWLDDVLPGERPDDYPAFSDDECRLAIGSEPGQQILVWLALRDDGIGWPEAQRIAKTCSEDDIVRLYATLTARRKTYEPNGEGKDLGKVWFGKNWAPWVQEFGLEAFKRLTVDQLDWLASGGKADEWSSEDAFAEAVRMFEEAKAAGKTVAEVPTRANLGMTDSELKDAMARLKSVENECP